MLQYIDKTNTDKTPNIQCSPATTNVGIIQYNIPQYAMIPETKLKNKTFLTLICGKKRIESIKGVSENHAKILFPNLGNERNNKIPLNIARKVW